MKITDKQRLDWLQSWMRSPGGKGFAVTRRTGLLMLLIRGSDTKAYHSVRRAIDAEMRKLP